MAFNMFYNPFAPMYSSNATISSQSKINSCVNENFSIQPSRFIPPISYPVYPAKNRGFVDQTPNLFDYDITESLCPDFNNLYLYERVWSPLNLKTVTTKETTKSSKTTHDSSTTCSIISPIAQSTPRAIRKTKNFSSSSSNESSSNSYNGKKEDELKDSPKGTLRQKKAECQNQKHFNQGYKKNQKNSWNDKKSFDSSFDSNEAVSPKQNLKNLNGNFKQRKLPLRSKGIDLSNFINKTSDAASVSSYGNSSDSSYNSKSFFDKHQGKVNIQNKCLFCENNGESEEIYMSHPLKDSLGKVVCPILRNFTCPKCGESGDYAHTNKYCPETQRKQKENKIRKYLTKKDF